jgi:hypothetical protein
MATISSPRIYMRPTTPVGSGTAKDVELERVRMVARVLDNYFLDPLIGLVVPGGGDVIGSLLGVYTVMIAVRRGVSPVVIARMIMNLGLDAVVGFIPLVGDLGDFAFKANKKNVDLLEKSLETRGGKASAKDWLVVVGAALAYIAIMAFVVWGIIRIFQALF